MQKFEKYHGTGNDFVMIDDRDMSFPANAKDYIAHICTRRFGVGADGLILLQLAEGYDFRMVYFNADGSESTMCGNGGRCTVRYAADLGLIDAECNFIAIDGPHRGKVLDDGTISIQMKDVEGITGSGADSVLNTGSPHYVRLVERVDQIDVDKLGAEIRYSDTFKAEGINVNFVQDCGEYIKVATYERGVEAETYSCGTGVVACALALASDHSHTREIMTKGGKLAVSYVKTQMGYTDIWLTGPATRVYDGSIALTQG